MRIRKQIIQRTETIAQLVREAGVRIGSMGDNSTPVEKRRATMARKVLRDCARELASIDLSISAARSWSLYSPKLERST